MTNIGSGLGSPVSTKTTSEIQHCQRAPKWISLWVTGALIVGTTLALLCGWGAALRYAFPAAAVIAGLILYRKAPISYISLVLWLWFLSPLIRRLVDWTSGWVDPSPVLLAAPIVTAITALGMIPNLGKIARPPRLLFVLAFAAVFFGLTVGVILNPLKDTALAGLTWLCPLTFGLHVAANEHRGQQISLTIRRTFTWGVLVMGAYGIVQYLAPAPWDAYWLEMINQQLLIPSFGTPEPYHVRVFSTLNAPGPFANTMMVGLLIVLSGSAASTLPSAIVGFISLLLSLVRATWLGWLGGCVLLVLRSIRRSPMRLLFRLSVIATLAIALTANAAFYEAVKGRIQSFSELRKDASVQDRSKLYSHVARIVLDRPFGTGLTTAIEFDGDVLDSGIVVMLISLGWFGTASYMLATIIAIRYAILRPTRSIETDNLGYHAAAVALIGQTVAGNIASGLAGVLLWTLLGLLLSRTQQPTVQRLDPGKRRPMGSSHGSLETAAPAL